MYKDLVMMLHEQAMRLPEKLGKNAELFGALTKAADAIEELNKGQKHLSEQVAKWQAEVVKGDCEAWLSEQDKPRWIPVTERLPEDGKDVLCFCRANIYFVLSWDGDHWHEGADRYYMSGFVTHWMPLPEPPKEET